MQRQKQRGPGELVIIGGAEDKTEKQEILKLVAKHAKGGRLCVISTASSIGAEQWETYHKIFRGLGVHHLSHIDTGDSVKKSLKALEDVNTVFFTGGDQLKLTSEIGGTPVFDRIAEILHQGGMVAGTSAGASAMSETMLIGDPEKPSSRVGASLNMGPGFGFIKNMVIDQHFAERGRLARLVAAISRNSRYIGIGIDEDTAICALGEKSFEVIGSGSVYVVDAHEKTACNIAEATKECSLSIFNMKLHVLCAGDSFDLQQRVPTNNRPNKRRAG